MKMETSSLASIFSFSVNSFLIMLLSSNNSIQYIDSSASSITMPNLAINSFLLRPLYAERVFAPTEVPERINWLIITREQLLWEQDLEV